jgi:hypothetical protein
MDPWLVRVSKSGVDVRDLERVFETAACGYEALCGEGGIRTLGMHDGPPPPPGVGRTADSGTSPDALACTGSAGTLRGSEALPVRRARVLLG